MGAVCKVGMSAIVIISAAACGENPKTVAPAGRTIPADASALTPTPLDEEGFWRPPRVFHGDPVAQARVDAEAAIVAGRPVRIRSGLPPVHFEDPRTGLRYANYGCEINDDMQRYEDAYNEAIDAARAQGRLKTTEPTKR